MKIIALLGPDGAGKSTVIDQIADTSGKEITVFHFRVGSRRNRSPVTEPYGRPPHGHLIGFAKVLWWHMRHWWWGLSRYWSRRPDIVIFDRFLYDIEVDPKRYRVSPLVAGLPWRRLVWPKPDTVVLVVPPVEVLQARKREVKPEETLQQMRGYLAIAHQLDDVLLVSTPAAPETIAAQVLTAAGANART